MIITTGVLVTLCEMFQICCFDDAPRFRVLHVPVFSSEFDVLLAKPDAVLWMTDFPSTVDLLVVFPSEHNDVVFAGVVAERAGRRFHDMFPTILILRIWIRIKKTQSYRLE